MDLTRDVLYRGFKLNDGDIKTNITSGGIGTGITGCVLDSVDISDVDVVQFMEKRSMQDGMDAGEVFKGARRVRMTGTLYGVSRALLFDARRDLRAALDPVLAQMDEPMDKGFRPIYWSEPTADEGYEDNQIDFRLLATPRAYQDVVNRDQLGGDDNDALAMPWHATMVCKDPLIYGAVPQDYVTEGGTQSVTLTHRGNYPSPLNLLFSIDGTSGSILFTANGTSNLITIPTSTKSRVIRYKGSDKLLTVEEDGSAEAPKLDWLTFNTDKNHAVISPGSSSLSLTVTGVTLLTGSHAWFWESYA